MDEAQDSNVKMLSNKSLVVINESDLHIILLQALL